MISLAGNNLQRSMTWMSDTLVDTTQEDLFPKPNSDMLYAGMNSWQQYELGPEDEYPMTPVTIIGSSKPSTSTPIDDVDDEPDTPTSTHTPILVPVQSVPVRVLNTHDFLIDNGDMYVPPESQLGRYLDAAQCQLMQLRSKLAESSTSSYSAPWGWPTQPLKQFKYRIQLDGRQGTITSKWNSWINRAPIEETVEQRLSFPNEPLVVDVADPATWVEGGLGWGWGCRLGRDLIVKIADSVPRSLRPLSNHNKTVKAIQRAIRRTKVMEDATKEQLWERQLQEESEQLTQAKETAEQVEVAELAVRVRELLDTRLAAPTAMSSLFWGWWFGSPEEGKQDSIVDHHTTQRVTTPAKAKAHKKARPSRRHKPRVDVHRLYRHRVSGPGQLPVVSDVPAAHE
jgi:hypothetical protein